MLHIYFYRENFPLYESENEFLIKATDTNLQPFKIKRAFLAENFKRKI